MGPDVCLGWTLPRKIVQRVMKINVYIKSLVERLCDFKIYAISVVSFVGSVYAPDKGTVKVENQRSSANAACPYNSGRSKFLGFFVRLS